MSGSESTDIWSTSIESHFDTTTTPTSSNTRSGSEPYPQRLKHLLAEKWKRLKCVRDSPQQEPDVATELLPANPPNIDPEHCTGGQWNPLRMNYMLKKRLEQLKIDMASPVERAPLIDETPSGSGTSSKPDGNKAASASNQPSTSKASDPTKAYMNKEGIAKFIQGNESSIFLLNFPEVMESADDSSDSDTDTLCPSASQPSSGDWPLRSGVNGLMRIYDSGRVIVSFGKKHFVMSSAPKPAFSQEVVSVDTDEETQISYMSSMGIVKHYANVSPLIPNKRCQCDICLIHHANGESSSSGE